MNELHKCAGCRYTVECKPYFGYGGWATWICASCHKNNLITIAICAIAFGSFIGLAVMACTGRI